MAEKSDGVSDITEQIRRLEREKEALEKRQKEKEEADRDNEETRLLQRKLTALQQDVSSLKDNSPANISASTSSMTHGVRLRRSHGLDIHDSDVLSMLGDNRIVRDLHDQFLSSPRLTRGNTVHSEDESSENDEREFPVRWTAPEAMFKFKFSIKSDVWSFGILMYEIITLGRVPYPGMNNMEVIECLRNGYRMPKPTGNNVECPDWCYETLMTCLRENPEERPTFEHLYNMFVDEFSNEPIGYVGNDE